MYVWSVSIKLRGWNGHLLALFPGPSPCSFLSLVQPKNRAGLGMRLGICPLWILAAPLEKILKVCKATHAFTMIVSPLEWFSEWNNMVVTEYPQHIGNPQHNNNPIRTVGSHNNVSHFRLENYHWPLQLDHRWQEGSCRMNGKWEGYNQATPSDLKALHCLLHVASRRVAERMLGPCWRAVRPVWVSNLLLSILRDHCVLCGTWTLRALTLSLIHLW